MEFTFREKLTLARLIYDDFLMWVFMREEGVYTWCVQLIYTLFIEGVLYLLMRVWLMREWFPDPMSWKEVSMLAVVFYYAGGYVIRDHWRYFVKRIRS